MAKYESIVKIDSIYPTFMWYNRITHTRCRFNFVQVKRSLAWTRKCS